MAAGRLARARQRLGLALSVVGTEPVELFSGAITVAWGVALLWPWEPDSLTAPSFAYLEVVALWISGLLGVDGEGAIGAFCVAMGAVSILSMLFGFERTRIVTQYVCLVWWVFLLVVVGAANPKLPGLTLYAGQAVMRLWTALRLLNIIRRPRYGLLGDDYGRS